MNERPPEVPSEIDSAFRTSLNLEARAIGRLGVAAGCGPELFQGLLEGGLPLDEVISGLVTSGVVPPLDVGDPQGRKAN